jgi:hypothetical protein
VVTVITPPSLVVKMDGIGAFRRRATRRQAHHQQRGKEPHGTCCETRHGEVRNKRMKKAEISDARVQ